ncbi:MAG TPA: hypothetical protein VGK67_17410, partial [Myxococcales bacterium]
MTIGRTIAAVLAAALAGCSVNIDPLPGHDGSTGLLDGSTVSADAGPNPSFDAGPRADVGTPDSGTVQPGRDAGNPAGPDAAAPGPDAATDPCASLTCGSNAHCDPNPTPHCA